MTNRLEDEDDDGFIYTERNNGDPTKDDLLSREETDLYNEILSKLPTLEECNRVRHLLDLAEMALEKLERSTKLVYEGNRPRWWGSALNTAMAWGSLALIGWGAWMLAPPAAPIVVGCVLLAGLIWGQSSSEGAE